MAEWQKCPDCYGSGMVPFPAFDVKDKTEGRYCCRRCRGIGLILEASVCTTWQLKDPAAWTDPLYPEYEEVIHKGI